MHVRVPKSIILRARRAPAPLSVWWGRANRSGCRRGNRILRLLATRSRLELIISSATPSIIDQPGRACTRRRPCGMQAHPWRPQQMNFGQRRMTPPPPILPCLICSPPRCRCAPRLYVYDTSSTLFFLNYPRHLDSMVVAHAWAVDAGMAC